MCVGGYVFKLNTADEMWRRILKVMCRLCTIEMSDQVMVWLEEQAPHEYYSWSFELLVAFLDQLEKVTSSHYIIATFAINVRLIFSIISVVQE